MTISTRGGQGDGSVSVAVEDGEMAVIDELMRFVSSLLQQARLHDRAPHRVQTRSRSALKGGMRCYVVQSLPRLAGWDQALA